MNTSRAYVMTARAASTARTGERILDAAIELFWQRPTDELSLAEVARRAGVSVQTVIRRFGGKDGVLAAAGAREAQRVSQQRGTAPVGDVAGAVAVLVDHYEEMGERVLKLLAEESRVPELGAIVAQGRLVHRAWCADVFAPALAARPEGPERTRLLAQLVAVCDLMTWHCLRHVAGLDRPETERALVELLEPLMEDAR
ncbi:MAG TPA: helix-turn-helix domain-containing protein [Candidatus Nanopelagicales bacterium]